MLLHLLFDNSIWSKSLIQCPEITVWMICRLRHRWFCNQCFSFCELYFRLQRRSIVLLWAQISIQCLVYPIYKTEDCWRSVDAHFQDGVKNILCTVLAEKGAITLYMQYCYEVTLWLPKMQDQQSLRLHWGSFTGWGRERATVVFATKGS